MPDRWYFYCAICEQWLPHTEYVSVKKGFRYKGHISFGLCKKCLTKIKKAKKRTEGE